MAEFVLEDARLRPEQIDKVLLVGGSTRMRAVPALLQRIFGRPPSCELHPDKVVALGAAIQGALLAKSSGSGSWVDPGALPEVAIRDVTSHGLGVVALDGVRNELYNTVVLPRGTPYGQKAEEVFCTVADGQATIRLRVTQGDERVLANTTVVFEHEVPIPSYPAGTPIRVSFLYRHLPAQRIPEEAEPGDVPGGPAPDRERRPQRDPGSGRRPGGSPRAQAQARHRL